MKTIEQIAIEVLKCAISWEPNACLMGNVTAREVATLAQHLITCCPSCGSEPWCNIDCQLCEEMHKLAAAADGDSK